MKYLSICSGIEAASMAWHEMGWMPVGFSEIEPFPSAVLAHHYPDVPNFGDMTKYEEWDIGTDQLDLLVGGTPCQAFSVAGLRNGLADHRGNLTLTFIDLADHFDPEWIIWESVPGVLSSKDNAFGCFLAGLCGEGEAFVPDGKWAKSGVVSGPKRTVAWRILDAQYTGVAQRRRRVFVCAVRGAGNWAAPAALFPVGESVHWNSAPSRKAREGAARSAAFSAGNSSGSRSIGYVEEGTPPLRAGSSGTNQVPTTIICHGTQDPCVSDIAFAQGRNNGGENVVLQPIPFDTTQLTSPHNYSSPKEGDPCHPLAAGAHAPAVVLQPISIHPHCIDRAPNAGPQGKEYLTDGSAYCMDSTGQPQAVAMPMAVRRLTPVECARLQGFPDDYLDIEFRGKPAADGNKYKALGNSMAVPVMTWIGQRITAVTRIREAA
jgi:DNA (cytosine-5)-methyltransferase 1